MLDLNMLLEKAGLEPKEVLLIRHQPREKELRRVFPWLVAERPDLFQAWQGIQWKNAAQAMTKAKWIAAFVALEGGQATFAGLSRVKGWAEIDYDQYWSFPGIRELHALGMTALSDKTVRHLAFDLETTDILQQWVGKLVIRWNVERSWWRWAANGVFEVVAISDESRLVRAIPGWREIGLSWAELKALPSSWRAALSQWRGIYFIFDTKRQLGYVGSAYGAENILGRWRNYADTGHGGNKQLKESSPEMLRFSILELTSPSLPPEDVIALEEGWKQRLNTICHGLNS